MVARSVVERDENVEVCVCREGGKPRGRAERQLTRLKFRVYANRRPTS